MQGSHKPYECGFDSHLNLQFIGDTYDLCQQRLQK
ncbi:phage protein [Escherichia phage L27]|uniref:Phage protein n=1 Tax=Escherichia phage L27 TaxID=2562890 RepID=A0A455XIL6_9CAUD|nr:phage protein [Escherichia phage L27]